MILDVVYNTPPRATTSGRCSRSRGSTTSPTTAPSRDARHYMDYTGTGNSLNPVHPAVLRLIMDSLRYFVIECHVDGRFDLASALARVHEVDRLGLLRHHPPGSGPLPGEADRRAVGRRRGRLPGRQLPRPLDGVEQDLPRHDARLLARPGRRERVREAVHRPRATSTSTTAAGRSRRSTSSRPTTASRCTTSSPTTTSTTRRTWRETGTATTTTAAGTTASRADRRPRDQPAPPAAAAELPRDAAALQGVPMLPMATRSRAAGNNNAYRQDNASWFDWELDERQRHLLAFTRRLIDFPPATRSSAGPTSSPVRSGSVGLARRLVNRPGRRKMAAAELAGRLAYARRLPERGRDPDPEPAGRAGDRRLVPDPLQRPG